MRQQSLDPRCRLLILMLFMAAAVGGATLPALLFPTLFFLLTAALSGVTAAALGRALRPFLFLLFCLALGNILFADGGADNGTVWGKWGPFCITAGGVEQAALIFMRLSLLTAGGVLLALSTPPLALMAGLNSWLRPLAYLHFPVDTLTLMAALTLRLLPEFAAEAKRQKTARLARGADFSPPGLWRRAAVHADLALPLIISALNRGRTLARAMDARGFAPNAPRTAPYIPRWGAAETLAAAAAAGLAAVTILM